MTRRVRRATPLAAIAGIIMLVTVGRDAAAYPPPPPPLDLSHLEFAPALPAGAVPVVVERAPALARAEPQKADRAQLDKAVTEQLDAIQTEEQANGKYSKDLASELLSLAVLYQQRGDHILAIPVLERARQIIRYNEGSTLSTSCRWSSVRSRAAMRCTTKASSTKRKTSCSSSRRKTRATRESRTSTTSSRTGTSGPSSGS